MHVHPLENPDVCTGCGACAAVCPVNCIAMQPDAEGFLHPRIGTDSCTDCDLCRQTCPVNQAPSAGKEKPGGPLQVFAAWHLDELIRLESSSGGVFTALAENILSQGGAVVGAAFDDQLVVRHILIETSADLHRLRGSKYVQSEVSSSLYRQILDSLRQERLVLFTGTPCQVAGLRNFLHKSYDNLFCCDLICHGTPSPLLWARYIEHNKMKMGSLAGFSFRDKMTGWKTFGVRLYMQNGRSRYRAFLADPYAVAFVRDYSLRPSCYICQFTKVNRCGDLTLADFWSVTQRYPEYDPDDKGTSLVLVNTKKGKDWLNACRASLFLGVADLSTAIAGQVTLVLPYPRPLERQSFFHDLELLPFSSLVRKYRLHPPSFVRRILRALKRRLLCRK